MSLLSTNRSYLGFEYCHHRSAAWSRSLRPSHSAARSGRSGVRVSLTRNCAVMVCLSFGRQVRSGPKTRLYALPSLSLSVPRKLMYEFLPKSCLKRPMATVDSKSCGAKSEPKAEGMMTEPPPRSCATRMV